MSSPLVLKRKMNMFNNGNEVTKETNKTPTPMKQKREVWVAKKEEPLNASQLDKKATIELRDLESTEESGIYNFSKNRNGDDLILKPSLTPTIL